MDRFDAYRHFASKCVEQARRVDSIRDRSIMFEMALVWSRLAEYAAKTAARKERTEFINPPQLTASELNALGEGQKTESASGEA